MDILAHEHLVAVVAALSRLGPSWRRRRELEGAINMSFRPAKSLAAQHGHEMKFCMPFDGERIVPAPISAVIETCVAFGVVRSRQVRAIPMIAFHGPLALPQRAAANLYRKIAALVLTFYASRVESLDEDRCDRAGGDCECEHCGGKYLDHPNDARLSWMTVLCDGRRVKL